MELFWRRQTLTTRHRFATARGGISQKQTIVLELRHAGVTGRGEVVPSALYGQSLESAEAALSRAGSLLGDDPFAIEEIVAALLHEIDDQPATVCGIDAALHDWAGRRVGLPVWRMLGFGRPRVRTTFTIGVSEPEQTRAKLDEALAAGFDALKVKVGTPADEQNLSLIRERFTGPLLLDANEAWSAAEAPRRIAGLACYQPALIEQPLHRDDLDSLPELRDLGIPIFIDEGCQRPRDVLRLAGRVDGINVKLNKCGGIREALRMFALARVLGLRTMIGCFVSSSLAIAQALAIAGACEFADLDGALLLADDSFTGIERAGSALIAPDCPGLGVVDARQ